MKCTHFLIFLTFSFIQNLVQANEQPEDTIELPPDYTKVEVRNLIIQGMINNLQQQIAPPYPTRVHITTYCQNYGKDPVIVDLNDFDLAPKMDLTKDFVVLLHDWMDNVNRSFIVDSLKNYLEFYDVTVCYIDYSYFTTVTLESVNTTQLGIYVSEFVNHLCQIAKITPQKFTLVGHGFGATVAGIAGNLLNGQIGEIFGLDPLSPEPTEEEGSEPSSEDKHLRHTSAQFVQLVVTTLGALADSKASGHSIFFPSGGKSPQPGCKNHIFCAHRLAAKIFSESINPKHEFLGRRCKSPRGPCDKVYDQIGPSHSRKRGIFTSRTRDKSPYALGVAGV